MSKSRPKKHCFNFLQQSNWPKNYQFSYMKKLLSLLHVVNHKNSFIFPQSFALESQGERKEEGVALTYSDSFFLSKKSKRKYFSSPLKNLFFFWGVCVERDLFSSFSPNGAILQRCLILDIEWGFLPPFENWHQKGSFVGHINANPFLKASKTHFVYVCF